MDSTRIRHLKELQLKLIQKGFDLLRPGGVMVYSTCSFCSSQNEAIVSNLLQTNKNAELVHIFPDQYSAVSSTFLAGTIRFDPVKSKCSGLFVAKIKKIE